MCKFFSFVTEPEGHGGQRFYFDWNARKDNLKGEYDSHSTICSFYKLDEDKCNKFEFNPLTKEFKVDKINSSVDDTAQANDWVEALDFKRIVEPLVIKPIINPFLLPAIETVTDEQIEWLKQWDSVWDSVRASAGDSVRDSAGDSVLASAGAYISSFLSIQYSYDFSSCIKLWEAGLVPSYDGTTWRLHTGKDAHVVYEWVKEG